MNRVLKHNRLVVLLLSLSGLFLVLHLVVALRPAQALMMWYHIDDAYYYFQVARNAAAGGGFTFDGIGLSNGFHPLWMLVNLPVFYFARFNPYLPFRILVMVSALLTLGGGWLLYDLLRKALRPEIALLGSAIWLFFWPLHSILTQTGMETGLNAFCLLLFIWAIQTTHQGATRGGFLWLGFAAAGVLFARLDNLFLVLLFGLWLVFHQQPMRQLLLWDVLAWFITVFTSIILRVGLDARLAFLPSTEIFFAVLTAVRAAAFYALGLYRDPHDYSLQSLLLRLAAAVAASSALLFLFMFGLLALDIVDTFPRSAVIIEAGLALSLAVLIRAGLRSFTPPQPSSDLSIKTRAFTWLKKGALYLLPIALLLGTYLLWNQHTFGTPMPISGQIKQWWGTLLTVYGRKQASFWTILGILPNTREAPQPWFFLQKYLFQPVYSLVGVDPFNQTLPFLAVKFALTAAYGSLLAWVVVRRAPGIKTILHQLSFGPLLTTAVLLPLYYAFTGYIAMREWYWVPQIFVTFFLFLIVADTALAWAEKQVSPVRHLEIVMLVICLLLPMAFSLKLMQRFPAAPDAANTLDSLKITHYLETHTPAGSLIGMTGGGTEAYFIHDRTVINLDGLINSKAYYDLVRAGQGASFLDEIGLDYVLGHPYVLLQSDPYAWTFTDRLQKIETFEKNTLFSYGKP